MKIYKIEMIIYTYKIMYLIILTILNYSYIEKGEKVTVNKGGIILL